MKISTLLYGMLACVAVSTLTSCNNDPQILSYGDEAGAPKAKVYIDISMYPNSTFSGQINFDRYKGNYSINTDIVKFPIKSSRAENHDIEVQVGLDTALVRKYSKDMFLEYKLFPEEFIQYVHKSVTVKSGSRVSADSIEIAFNNVEKIPVGRYVFPISITSTSEGNDMISDKFKSVYYTISVKESFISIDREPLAGVTAMDRTKFVLTPSNYYRTALLVDGNYKTYWTPNNTYGSSVTIDLGSEEDIPCIALSPNYYYSYWSEKESPELVKNITLEGSIDGITFTKIDSGTMLKPTGTSKEPDIQYVKFKKTHLRYLKITASGSYGGSSISEIQIYK